MTIFPLFTLAAVLGDGCVGTPRMRPNSRYLSFTHSGKQRAYLLYKLERINAELGTNGSVSPIRRIYDHRTGKIHESCQAMITSPLLKPVHDLVYIEGEKTYTSSLLSLLGLEALALLWMDDGSVVRAKKIRNRGLLALYRPKPEAALVSEWIGDLTKAKALPYRDGRFWRIRIQMSQMPYFVRAIRPFVHSSMSYKVTLDYERNTNSSRVYKTSLTIPFVDEGDKATRARSTVNTVMI